MGYSRHHQNQRPQTPRSRVEPEKGPNSRSARRIRFTSVDDDGVRMRHVPQARQPWLISLGEGHVDESAIIYEIAHAWLGHAYDLERGEWWVSPREEQAACDLTRQWGFVGSDSKEVH